MDNRERILQCALELFYAKGYDAVGVQEIAQKAGITKPTLYYYFGSKYGLIVESEPDEGTTVTIHLPAVPYTKENCEVLETPGKPVRKEGES